MPMRAAEGAAKAREQTSRIRPDYILSFLFNEAGADGGNRTRIPGLEGFQFMTVRQVSMNVPCMPRFPVRRRLWLSVFCGAAWGLFALPAAAQDAVVAVAANFRETLGEVQNSFERETGYTLTVTTGSTGKLYAQIVHGAPYDMLLAADEKRPLLLEQNGLAAAGSRFTYAVGKLALWSPDPGRIGADGVTVLRRNDFRKLAIANPDLAPYGAAAMEVLDAIGAPSAIRTKIVMGENVGQTFALIASGNAELGFVALSYVMSQHNNAHGSRWDVPEALYSPIRQDAVLLNHGAGNPAASAFLDYLQGGEARAIIAKSGYGLANDGQE